MLHIWSSMPSTWNFSSLKLPIIVAVLWIIWQHIWLNSINGLTACLLFWADYNRSTRKSLFCTHDEVVFWSLPCHNNQSLLHGTCNWSIYIWSQWVFVCWCFYWPSVCSPQPSSTLYESYILSSMYGKTAFFCEQEQVQYSLFYYT